MDIESLRMFQAVKIGTKETLFAKDVDYEITLEGQFITLRCRTTGATSVTPITNTPYFVPKAPSVKSRSGKSRSKK